MVRIGLVLAMFGGTLASAQPASLFKQQGEAPRHFGNIRIGASSSSVRPELCGEVSPIELIAIEGCGTGSGFLHHDVTPEIAHFRAKVKMMSWQSPVGFLQPRVGLGFAELQVGDDAPGFYFANAGPTGVETAGPELGLSLRCLTPLVGGMELVSELNFNAAIFAHAPEMVRSMAVFQPSFSVSVGVGF